MPATELSFICTLSETTTESNYVPVYSQDHSGHLHFDQLIFCHDLHKIWKKILTAVEHRVSVSNIDLSESPETLNPIKTVEDRTMRPGTGYFTQSAGVFDLGTRLPVQIRVIEQRVILEWGLELRGVLWRGPVGL